MTMVFHNRYWSDVWIQYCVHNFYCRLSFLFNNLCFSKYLPLLPPMLSRVPSLCFLLSHRCCFMCFIFTILVLMSSNFTTIVIFWFLLIQQLLKYCVKTLIVLVVNDPNTSKQFYKNYSKWITTLIKILGLQLLPFLL